MEFIKKNLLAIIVAGAAVLALILGMILPPVADVDGEIKFFDIVFGFNESELGATASGGMSLFGLVSFVALIAGIALTIVSMFKGEKLGFIGSILIAVAGVCMLLIFVAGTSYSVEYGGQVMFEAKFSELYDGLKLGAGAIIYAIIAILGGGFGILNKYKKIV